MPPNNRRSELKLGGWDARECCGCVRARCRCGRSCRFHHGLRFDQQLQGNVRYIDDRGGTDSHHRSSHDDDAETKAEAKANNDSAAADHDNGRARASDNRRATGRTATSAAAELHSWL